ncbi:MAG: glycosyltransferase [Deltaproteobacteria bacterium]|nr:glycosyltransferase [Deltaproteobacteria bacterium]
MITAAVDQLYLQEGQDQAKAAVCVTLHNYERYLPGCLASVAAQTLPTLDLVVLDDCSEDASCGLARAWLEAHGHRFNRVELLRTRQNAGPVAAHNTAAMAAHSEYMLLLDADNELLPRALEDLLAALEDSGADFAFGLLERFGGRQAIMHNVLWGKELLARSNYWDTLALMRRESFEKAGGHDDLGESAWGDYVMWCEVAMRGGWGVHVPQFVGRYRVHDKSVSAKVDEDKIRRMHSKLNARFPEIFGTE